MKVVIEIGDSLYVFLGFDVIIDCVVCGIFCLLLNWRWNGCDVILGLRRG